jgi:hypothetical protein
MNEIVAILYFVLYNGAGQSEIQHVEADSFWCYFKVMSAFKEQFLFNAEIKAHPIQPVLNEFQQLLKM